LDLAGDLLVVVESQLGEEPDAAIEYPDAGIAATRDFEALGVDPRGANNKSDLAGPGDEARGEICGGLLVDVHPDDGIVDELAVVEDWAAVLARQINAELLVRVELAVDKVDG